MRVLQMGAFPPPYGGVQTNIVAIRRLLRDRGYYCGVMNLTRHRTSRAEDLYHPTSAWSVLRLLLTLRYDVLHLHHGGELSLRLLALYLICTLHPGKKTVLTCHSGGLAASAVGRRARPWSLSGFVFRRYDRIIVVNPEMSTLFQRYGVAASRIRLILPFALRYPDPARKLPATLARFFADHSPRLLTIGLLEPEYDLKLQIDVMEQILQQHPRAGLAIIGSGSLDEELRSYVRGQSYASHILMCGDVEHEDTLVAIQDCDVVLRTTQYDGDAVSVREALFMAKPVVVTDNGMRPAGVHLIPVGDAAALASAIHARLIAKPDVVHHRPQRDDGNIVDVLNVYHELTGTSPEVKNAPPRCEVTREESALSP